MLKLEWTDEDAANAEKQGWNVFSRRNDQYLPFALERVDEKEIFESDPDAERFVIDRAVNGKDELAIKAISYLLQEVGKTSYFRLAFGSTALTLGLELIPSCQNVPMISVANGEEVAYVNVVIVSLDEGVKIATEMIQADKSMEKEYDFIRFEFRMPDATLVTCDVWKK